MTKIISILRHAKAQTGDAHQQDKERGLAARGKEATQIVGKYLIEQGFTPERVLCSDAQRTTQTLAGIENVYDHPLPVQYLPQLYLASANEILAEVSQVPDNVQNLLVIAHNPGMHELAMKLAKQGDEEIIDIMAIKFPSCSLARFSSDVDSWGDLANESSELIDFVSPRILGQIIN